MKNNMDAFLFDQVTYICETKLISSKRAHKRLDGKLIIHGCYIVGNKCRKLCTNCPKSVVLILILLHNNNNECSELLIIIMELKTGLRIQDNNELFSMRTTIIY